MKKWTALCCTSLLLAPTAAAGQVQPGPGASPEEILTWIACHLEAVHFPALGGIAGPDSRDRQDTVEFEHCSVTVRSTELVHCEGDSCGDGDRYKATQGPFNPKDIVLDGIQVEFRVFLTGTPGLTLSLARPVRVGVESYDSAGHARSRPEVFHPLKAGIPFQTLEMARRHARAWNDAAVACGTTARAGHGRPGGPGGQ
jgi:hypothetical protein